jgi:hypothetical protein
MVFWDGVEGGGKVPASQNGSQNNRVKTATEVRCCYTTLVEVMCKRNLSFLPPFLPPQCPLPLPLSLSLVLHLFYYLTSFLSLSWISWAFSFFFFAFEKIKIKSLS